MAQVSNQYRDLVNTVMNLEMPQNATKAGRALLLQRDSDT